MASTSLSQQPSAHHHPRRLRWLDIQEQITGYLFILPSLIIITVFGFFPIGYAFYISLHNWRVKKGPFIGFDNYTRAIGDWGGALIFAAGFVLLYLAYLAWDGAFKAKSDRGMLLRLAAAVLLIGAWFVIPIGWEQMQGAGDPRFLNSLPITLFYAISTVPAELGLAMVLAYILFQKIRGQEFFRMLYFLPYITPVVASAVVFRVIFNPRDSSLANQLLSLVGLGPYKWLFEPRPANEVLFGLQGLEGFWAGPSLALVSIALFGIWTYVGYNTVIFLAGLGSIPHELYEAAEIDGAGKLAVFRNITLPLLSPVTFYLALIAFIGTFKAFNHIYVMKVPSAQGTVDVTSITIFETFYRANQYGYASAQAILLFIIILALTLIQNKVFGEKVFYG